MKYMIGFLAGIILLQGAVAHGHPPPDVTAEALALALSSNGNTAVDCSSGTTCTFDVDADGTADFTMSTSGLTVPRVANPCITFGDVNTSDTDDNAQICVNCTDTGSGTEDCDITISQQVAGAMTTVETFDADGPSSEYTLLGVFTNPDVAQSTTDAIMTSGATSRTEYVIPFAGTVRSMACYMVAGAGATYLVPLTTDTCTGTCYSMQLMINEADAGQTDCTMASGVGTCNVTMAKTFTALSRIGMIHTSAADVTANRDVECTVWGSIP